MSGLSEWRFSSRLEMLNEKGKLEMMRWIPLSLGSLIGSDTYCMYCNYVQMKRKENFSENGDLVKDSPFMLFVLALWIHSFLSSFLFIFSHAALFTYLVPFKKTNEGVFFFKCSVGHLSNSSNFWKMLMLLSPSYRRSILQNSQFFPSHACICQVRPSFSSLSLSFYQE